MHKSDRLKFKRKVQSTIRHETLHWYTGRWGQCLKNEENKENKKPIWILENMQE